MVVAAFSTRAAIASVVGHTAVEDSARSGGVSERVGECCLVVPIWIRVDSVGVVVVVVEVVEVVVVVVVVVLAEASVFEVIACVVMGDSAWAGSSVGGWVVFVVVIDDASVL